MRRGNPLWLATIGLLCAGCAGSHGGPAPAGPQSTSGAVLFAHNCSACHSLVGNESLRKQGGDLLGYRLTRAQLLGFARVMPTRPLSPTELESVVSYILRAQARVHR